MQSPAYEQTAFRGRNDDGSETGATWKDSTNAGYIVNPALSDIHRIRIAVAEVNGASDNNREFQLQYSKNGGSWTNVSTSTANVQAVTSSNVSDGTQTTQQITSETFAGGEIAAGDALAGDSSPVDFAGNDVAEVEYVVQVISSDVSQGDTIELRAIFGDGTVLGTYTNVASFTVEYDQSATASPAATAAEALEPAVVETRVIGGACTLNGAGVSDAEVYVVDSDAGVVAEKVVSESDGSWSVSVETASTYHVAAQYTDGTDQWNAMSNPYLL